MYYKRICYFIIILLTICTHITGKKIKKPKRQKENVESTTIAPNVVAYSTFGFNDVGSYDGFVPTSPEYSSFLSGGNRESSTKLYAPAFPSAADTTGFSGNYDSQSFHGQTFGVNKDEANQAGMSQYTSNSMNFMSSPHFVNGEQNKNTNFESINHQNSEDLDAPVHGTKINSKYKNKNIYPSGNVDFAANSNVYSMPTADNNYFNFQEIEQTQEKPAFSEGNSNKQNINSYFPNHLTQETESIEKIKSSTGHNIFNFPRVVDFTNLSNKYYPTELDTSKLTSDSMSNSNQQTSMTDSPVDNISMKHLSIPYNKQKFADISSTKFEELYSHKNNEDLNKDTVKSNAYMTPRFTRNHIVSNNKNSENILKNPDHNKKIKYKPSVSTNYSDAIKDLKDVSSSLSTPVKGYSYSTNYSNMNFRYDTSEPQKPFNPDEIVPASSNLIDSTAYIFPETDYNKFKKMPKYNNDFDEYVEGSQHKDKFKSGDYLTKLRNSYNELQTTTSSYWGSNFKSTDYTSFRDHFKKPHAFTEINHDDIVNIPKRPQKLSFTKGSQDKQVDWSSNHYRPQKPLKPMRDWTKDFLDTRYKSEEDLLGLRNHDTSHPSYLPMYKPSINDDDDEFKNLVENWKQSYIKAKYKDMPIREHGSYGSDVKPYHVPILKPYPIEVPHPVIVPVPRPFPVQVPISRPVAVPILQEITVPIEKPVPYPVYKNVPYPVEKPVPVPVEKEVTVPVEKPYPVHIPHIRPVFHHTKPVHEDLEHYEEEEYLRRPEYKKPSHYKKRTVYGTRNNKSRRPSRSSYQDRNRRRWPDRRRPSSYRPEYRHSARPNGIQHSTSYKRPSFESLDEDDHEYEMYCRNTGKC